MLYLCPIKVHKQNQSNMNTKEYATEVIRQLTYRSNIFVFGSWGAHALRYGNDDLLGVKADFLQMRVKGRKFKGYVRIYIIADIYQLVFMNFKKEVVKTIRDVYVDEYVRVLDGEIERDY